MVTQVEAPLVKLENIWKSFPGVLANKGAHFDLQAGEVHPLLGENGAGQTTLMNILAGLYRADQGGIFVESNQVEIRHPQDAIAHGIGMVHQHFRLVNNLSVAENIHLGWEQTPRFTSPEALAKRTETLSAEMEFDCDPYALIEQLSVGEQQRIEIIKVLARGARILILDEPTAVLTPQEAKELFKTLRKMTDDGRSIIFITHKLKEVLDVSDRVTVLRNGRNIGTLPTAICDARAMARLMVGQHVSLPLERKRQKYGETILALDNLTAKGDHGLASLNGFTLNLRKGEILGVAGVSGNGQSELAEVITGLRALEEGKIFLDDEDWTGKPAAEIAEAGVGHIPEDRNEMGLVLNLPVLHSAIMRGYNNEPLRKGLWLLKNEAAALALRLMAEGDVRAPNIGVLVRGLSGGNQQKLVTRREIDIAEKVLVAMHPTRGLDVAATEAVRQALIEHRDNGVGILLISEDLDEIFSIADRIAVIYEGQITGLFDAAQASRNDVGLLMGGSRVGMENMR